MFSDPVFGSKCFSCEHQHKLRASGVEGNGPRIRGRKAGAGSFRSAALQVVVEVDGIVAFNLEYDNTILYSSEAAVFVAKRS